MVGTVPSLIRNLATAVFVLALPIFLVTSAVRTVTLSQSFYLGEFSKYRIAEVTGIAESELRHVAEQFIAYFESRPTPLNIQAKTLQGTVPLFNAREIEHMADVHTLMQRTFQATWIAAGMLVVSGLVILLVDLSSGKLAFLRAISIGGLTTVALVCLVAFGSLFDFSRLFYLFHTVSFSNDLWLLDPRTDRLIQLFPSGFFFDAAIQIAVQAATFGGAMAGIALIGQRFLK